MAGSFARLTRLRKLDLSQNQLARIAPATFSGLRLLRLLRLDENHGLELAPGAFVGAQIAGLSLEATGLTKLKLTDLEPLLRSGVGVGGRLESLNLANNALTGLEAGLELGLSSLQPGSLVLEGNPWRCDCRLAWLARLLARQARQAATPGLASQPGPVCQEPVELAGRQVDSLRLDELVCTPPRLTGIEVELTGLSRTVDFPEYAFNEVDDGVDFDGLVARLRCLASGSQDLNVTWFRRVVSPGKTGTSLQLEPESRSPSLGVAELHLHQTSITTPGNRWRRNRRLARSYSHLSDQLAEITKEETRRMEQEQEQEEHEEGTGVVATSASLAKPEMFTCLVIDANGKTTADVSLIWPKHLPASNVHIPIGKQQHFQTDSNIRKEVAERIDELSSQNAQYEPAGGDKKTDPIYSIVTAGGSEFLYEVSCCHG
ncbi:unnamed protein product [Protopolystoma xenopodis]|uniref:Ig-like domain-containing protein n=1 Tax=Protopolystoma xenopodis TaxID=117903 RepID=A0A448XLK1_9PLAT|nr:unnamed protein product [Protopolystoma xenopodis]